MMSTMTGALTEMHMIVDTWPGGRLEEMLEEVANVFESMDLCLQASALQLAKSAAGMFDDLVHQCGAQGGGAAPVHEDQEAPTLAEIKTQLDDEEPTYGKRAEPVLPPLEGIVVIIVVCFFGPRICHTRSGSRL